MNLIDAVKSGRAFRRKDWISSGQWLQDDWAVCGKGSWNAYSMIRVRRSNVEVWLYHADYVANDWELEPSSEPQLKAWLISEHSANNYSVVFSERDLSNVDNHNTIRAEWLDQLEPL